jgi:hypothetical protein
MVCANPTPLDGTARVLVPKDVSSTRHSPAKNFPPGFYELIPLSRGGDRPEMQSVAISKSWDFLGQLRNYCTQYTSSRARGKKVALGMLKRLNVMGL